MTVILSTDHRKDGVWSNGRTTVTGKYIYSGKTDTCIVWLNTVDPKTGIRRVIRDIKGPVPEWGDYKLTTEATE